LDYNPNTNCLDKERATPLFQVIKNGADISLIRRFLLHDEATLHFSGDQPEPALSDAECVRLLTAYRDIEIALEEGLNAVIAHKDLHLVISSYYLRG
jgi:hypothetical protein